MNAHIMNLNHQLADQFLKVKAAQPLVQRGGTALLAAASELEMAKASAKAAFSSARAALRPLDPKGQITHSLDEFAAKVLESNLKPMPLAKAMASAPLSWSLRLQAEADEIETFLGEVLPQVADYVQDQTAKN